MHGTAYLPTVYEEVGNREVGTWLGNREVGKAVGRRGAIVKAVGKVGVH